jgi:hypothetical protein
MPGDGMAAFERWQQLVTSADRNAEAPVEWAAFESLIGLQLPADYKAYIDVYGVACINRLFWVRHPTSKDMPNLLQAPYEWRSAQDEQDYLETHLTAPPLPFGVGHDRLMLCADGDDGESQVYWDTSDDDPHRWPVVLGDTDGDTWTRVDMTLVEFLLALFTNRLPQLGFTEAGFVRAEVLVQRHPHTTDATASWAATRAPDGD